MSFFRFEPVARLQRFLGSELIADPNLAVIEFIKNAYDADATDVYLDLEIAGRPKESQVMTISDNGSGMDRESFQKNWMHPGYSYKAEQSQQLASGGGLRRVPVGEKGLGRLAAGRLAAQMHVYTRLREQDPWLHVFIDWDQFDRMDTLLNEIPVPFDEVERPRNPRFTRGTVVALEHLTVDWTRKLPGRKAPGRSDHRLGRLREDLGILLQPLPLQGHRDFTVYLCPHSPQLRKYEGAISPTEPTFLDYQFEIRVEEVAGRIRIERRIRRSGPIAEKVGRPEVSEDECFMDQLRGRGELEDLPTNLVCGPFSGVLYYSPFSSDRLKRLGITPGVFLYRDSLRVEPYGQEGDDWLGATAWKASRQGYAPIQPKHLNGYFAISRTANPQLRDMSNRQGLVDNDAYRAFLALARYGFRWFADLVFGEYVQPHWETRQARAQRAAQRTQAFGVLVIRAMAHAVRQSTSGLGAELSTLHQLAKRYAIPDEARVKLLGLEQRSWAHLEAIEQTVARFLQFDQQQLTALESFEEIVLEHAMEEAVSRTRPLADSKGVELRLQQGRIHRLVFSKETLVSAVAELISNGIDAAHSAKREKGWVKVSTERASEGGYEISVEDNGMGVDPSKIDELFSKPSSDKGRPGAGLMLTKEALALAGGRISLKKTGPGGSVFQISLPSGKELTM